VGKGGEPHTGGGVSFNCTIRRGLRDSVAGRLVCVGSTCERVADTEKEKGSVKHWKTGTSQKKAWEEEKGPKGAEGGAIHHRAKSIHEEKVFSSLLREGVEGGNSCGTLDQFLEFPNRPLRTISAMYRNSR